MKVFAFMGKKGGSGKSTLVTSLAVIPKTKTLIIDCDPQRTSGDWWQARPESSEYPQYKFAESGDVKQILKSAKAQGFEFVFIDTQGRDTPSNKLLTDLADIVVLPCQPSAPDIWALDSMIINKRKTRIVINHGYSQGARNNKSIALLSEIASTCPVPVVRRATYQDAIAMGQGVTELQPKSKASLEIQKIWEWLQ